MSDANKLLIRCAWTGESAFADAGYDEDSWASGRCPPQYKMEFGGSSGDAGVVGPAVGGAVGALFLLVAVVAAVFRKRKRCLRCRVMQIGGASSLNQVELGRPAKDTRPQTPSRWF